MSNDEAIILSRQSVSAWPEKMITQAEAFAKAANWPTHAERRIRMVGDPPAERHEVHLMCAKVLDSGNLCGQSCGQLDVEGTAYNGSLDEMLSMVLRHMVMAHDVPLNTRAQDNGPSDGSTP